MIALGDRVGLGVRVRSGVPEIDREMAEPLGVLDLVEVGGGNADCRGVILL